MRKQIIIFLKGMLMGICDIIPGISGGTIAFITGIYTRLIEAVKSFSFTLIKDLFVFIFKKDKGSKKKFFEGVKKLDLVFLITLGGGIGTAMLLMSRILSYLLENQFSFTISFFIGLILASSKIIYDNIEKHNIKNLMFGFFGLIFGGILAFITPAELTPNYIYIFFGGFLAISAMFLPGISGAFIMLIIGIYEFMLNVLHEIIENISYVLVFGAGAVCGALSISRIISYLFKKDRCKTLYFLLGLVIGSLSIPLKKVYANTASFGILNTSIMIGLFLLGIFLVRIVAKIEKNAN